MTQDNAQLADHLNGLIMLIRATDRSPWRGCAALARTVRRIAEIQQATALGGLNGRPMWVRITGDDIFR
ncbi:hypothetical protein N825_29810 [Skermanella stibiiresistens SB22]|uniref:Uncharacterized protein n=1 Tax=Skermanella stibiiresistens SB22 TaxID=1385369 RepID=W9GQL5_9PROT|nr:hypothetical protein [Skermanella stibiiresistens]EWY36160.1 hypothetical protein N825_29810 [Skermanella stibiiresistens SB22]